MYDFSQPNAKPGECCKCHGTKIYRWGTVENGVPKHSGTCFSCRGTGYQDKKQIKTNHGYNYFKLRTIGV